MFLYYLKKKEIYSLFFCLSINVNSVWKVNILLLFIVNNWVKIGLELLCCCELRYCESVDRVFINCFVVNVYNLLGLICF